MTSSKPGLLLPSLGYNSPSASWSMGILSPRELTLVSLPNQSNPDPESPCQTYGHSYEPPPPRAKRPGSSLKNSSSWPPSWLNTCRADTVVVNVGESLELRARPRGAGRDRGGAGNVCWQDSLHLSTGDSARRMARMEVMVLVHFETMCGRSRSSRMCGEGGGGGEGGDGNGEERGQGRTFA